MDARIFNKIKSKITTTKFGDLPWSQILAQYGNTKTNRKYFLYGVAIHLVSDSFAHRIWYKENGVVGKYMKHPDADNPIKCENRFKVAKEAVRNVLISAEEPSVTGDYFDIAWGLDKFNNTFARENLYQCIIDIAGSDTQLVEDMCNVKKIKNASHTQK